MGHAEIRRNVSNGPAVAFVLAAQLYFAFCYISQRTCTELSRYLHTWQPPQPPGALSLRFLLHLSHASLHTKNTGRISERTELFPAAMHETTNWMHVCRLTRTVALDGLLHRILLEH
jgi:hypothetical protein